jgi:hypothetical protein
MSRVLCFIGYLLMTVILSASAAFSGDTISNAFEDAFGHDQIPNAFEDTFGHNKIPNAFNKAFGGGSSGSHHKTKKIQSQSNNPAQ